MTIEELIALFISTIVVSAFVQIVKVGFPWLKARADWIIGPLALFLGGLVPFLASRAVEALGVPVDVESLTQEILRALANLSTQQGLLSGGTAAASFKLNRGILLRARAIVSKGLEKLTPD